MKCIAVQCIAVHPRSVSLLFTENMVQGFTCIVLLPNKYTRTNGDVIVYKLLTAVADG